MPFAFLVLLSREVASELKPEWWEVTGIQIPEVRTFQAEQTAGTESQVGVCVACLRDRKLGSMAQAE